jgi:glycerol-3-phosphate O-acyltransferase
MINRAAMKVLNEEKYKGKLVLVFPAGTRYREWDPETKKGVREIDSYIRSFDYMCFVSLNGKLMHVQKSDMTNDLMVKDVILVTAGPVVSCKEFRENIKTTAENASDDPSNNIDKKQAVADAIMQELEKMHIAAEEKRKEIV